MASGGHRFGIENMFTRRLVVADLSRCFTFVNDCNPEHVSPHVVWCQDLSEDHVYMHVPDRSQASLKMAATIWLLKYGRDPDQLTVSTFEALRTINHKAWVNYRIVSGLLDE